MRSGTGSVARHIFRMMVVVSGLFPASHGQTAEREPTKQGQVTDKFGNRWTLTPSGNLVGSSLPIRRGWVTYLYVDDQNHSYSASPPKADKKPRARLMDTPGELTGDARFDFQSSDQRDVQWTHFVRFDSGRGGMRFIEVFSNAGTETHAVRVRFDTDVNVPNSEAFQGATIENGEIISNENPALPDSAKAVMFHFTPGYSAAQPFFVIGGVQNPWTASRTASGYRMTLEYSGTLEPGRRAIVVHWIGGRGAKETGKPEKAIERLLRDGKLVDPGVPVEWQPDVINFPKEAFQAPSSPAKGDGIKLVMLDQLCKRLGLERSGKDHLVLDGTTRIEGEAQLAKATLERGGRSVEIAPEDIAGISGGSGKGRDHRVYLRDGSVLAGHLRLEGARFTSLGTGEAALDANALDCLVLSRAEAASHPAGNVAGVVKTNRGEVLHLGSLPAAAFTGRTSAGTVEIPWSEIVSVRERSSPDPCFIIRLKDGSRVTCLPALHDTVFRLAGGDEWRAEADLNAFFSSAAELEALPAPDKENENRPEGGWCELAHGTVWAGHVAGVDLQIDSPAGPARFKTGDLKSIRRPDGLSAPTGAGDVFEVELKTGLKLRGRFYGTHLKWQRGGQTLELPWSQVVEVGMEVAK